MEFADLGTHCFFDLCGQQTFLPLECRCCSRLFCKLHVDEESHHCTQFAIKEAASKREVKANIKRIKKSKINIPIYKCHRRKCKKMEWIKIQCKQCLLTFCIKHRFHDLHQDRISKINKNIVHRPKSPKIKASARRNQKASNQTVCDRVKVPINRRPVHRLKAALIRRAVPVVVRNRKPLIQKDVDRSKRAEIMKSTQNTEEPHIRRSRRGISKISRNIAHRPNSSKAPEIQKAAQRSDQTKIRSNSRTINSIKPPIAPKHASKPSVFKVPPFRRAIVHDRKRQKKAEIKKSTEHIHRPKEVQRLQTKNTTHHTEEPPLRWRTRGVKVVDLGKVVHHDNLQSFSTR